MSKTLVRYVMALCVAAVALTASQSVRAADEKAAAPAVAHLDTLTGKVEATDVKASTITIKHEKESKTFTVAPDCKFSPAGDKGDKKVTLAHLVIGDQVHVTYAQEGDKLVAHHIHRLAQKKTEEAPQAK